ncbi:hypothetical protein RUND412_002066 [Rhizina undulata]
MERLPTEILHEIMGCLPETDIDSVRFVNHELSAVANVLKHRVLRVCATREGLNHLLYVSQQPELARCVHEIVYPWNLLPTWNDSVSPDEFEMFVLDGRIDLSELDMYIHLTSAFLGWYDDNIFTPQLELEDSGDCIAALENGLSRMSNIRVLCPGQLDNGLATSDKFDDWTIILAGSGEYNIDDTNLSLIWGFLMFPRIFSVKDEDRKTKHFMELIGASYRAGLKPYKLGTTTCSWPNALWYGFFDDSSEILRNSTPLIASLTSVSFSLGTFYSDKAFKQEAKKGRMLKFLCSAPNLRSLSLSFILVENPIQSESGNYSTPDMFSLFDIVGRTRIWKHLHTFRLRMRYVNPVELVYFLTCHSKTLKDFEMDVNEVPGGTWRGVLDFLNEKLQLTKFKLQLPIELLHNDGLYVYRGEELRKMEAYVLHEGPPFPQWPWN